MEHYIKKKEGSSKMNRKKKFSLAMFINSSIVLLFSCICLFPMVLALIVSFTDETAIQRYGYSLLPTKLSLYAYELIFQGGSNVVRAYGISVIITIIGTLVALVITGLAAYSLSNKSVKYRSLLGLFFFIPMVFSAGIVPWYLISRGLGLKDNLLALIIPSLLFNPFNLFLVRNFMSGIPESLRESATIDGANDALIAFKIYFPLCVPVLATIGLFYGLAYWNDWWNAIMLIDNHKIYPVQYLLLELKSQISMLRELQFMAGIGTETPPAESLKMATAIITVGPIVLLYPYLQRYFVKGLIIGSVKG